MRTARVISAEVVRISGKLGKETDKAISFKLDDDNTDLEEIPAGYVWFPFSQVKEIHRTFSLINGTPDELVISAWIARQKGMVS